MESEGQGEGEAGEGEGASARSGVMMVTRDWTSSGWLPASPRLAANATADGSEVGKWAGRTRRREGEFAGAAGRIESGGSGEFDVGLLRVGSGAVEG